MSSQRQPAPRIVSLLIDEPRGCTESFEVTSPWWQEAAPVVDEAEHRFGVPVTIVRLLENGGPYPGGAVTYLAEAPEIDPGHLSPAPPAILDRLAPDPNRAAHAAVGAPSQLLDWATTALTQQGIEVVGRPRQIRTWNLAAIWQIPTTKGAVWCKATPDFLGHESQVLRALARTGRVPQLIAGERGRALMHEVPGEDGYQADKKTLTSAVDVLIEIQRNRDQQELEGVPVLDEATMATRLDDLAERQAHVLNKDERAKLSDLQGSLSDRFNAAAPLGTTLVHGDLHGGNLRLSPNAPPIILDWGDSFIGSPLFDVFTLESYDMPGADRIRQHWLGALSEATGADVVAAWTAFRPVAAVLLPLVYQRFCDNIEQSELPYHDTDIAPALQRALKTIDA